MESRLKGQAVPVSDNPDGDVRLNVQESAEAIVRDRIKSRYIIAL